MLKQSKKYRLLAFITLVKFQRRNSIVDKNMAEVKFANMIGVSYPSYKKYKRACLDLGLAYEVNGHTFYKAMKDVLVILDLPQINRHVRFFNKAKYSKKTFNEVYKRISEEIYFNKLRQQEYFVNKNQVKYNLSKSLINNRQIASKVDRAMLKSLRREAINKGKGLLEYAQSIVIEHTISKKNIVTGKNHAATVIGMSTATGSNRIKALQERGLITERVTVYKKYSNIPYNNTSFDALKSSTDTGVIVPSSKNKVFTHYLGSKITLINPIDEYNMV